MPFPEAARVELPILQELQATGGSDQLRYLYERLVRHFPQITPEELGERGRAGRSRWHFVVQRAGRQLIESGDMRRERASWVLTEKGRRRVEAEAMRVTRSGSPSEAPKRAITHSEAQEMLVDLGLALGFHAEAEFDYYDVVWREAPSAPRLSHVFEVQVSGSVDSALTRLKQAFDLQRSRLFLVIADERAGKFADRRLSGSFHEIWDQVTVIGVGELKRLHDSVREHRDLLSRLV
ncbi:MAG TPA: winged helix-turn-helix domain-containing protein [Blastocatellia bacterium]|nr:winged helix-turn-helix domain-containing protein [Blastocatellia bacterium]